MIKALLLDLGDTLIDSASEKPFPGVEDALGVIETFETADHAPLVVCLVSDYTMPEPRTSRAIAATFAEYLELLDRTGLRRFFEPVEERVTLSTHAGARKPDALVFETAFKRAGVDGGLNQALFITENAEHIAACRKLGMKTLRYGTDFTSWSQAPLLISQDIGAAGFKNSEAVFRPALADRGLRLQSIEDLSPNKLRGTARNLVQLHSPDLGSFNDVHVELPVEVAASLDSAGRITTVHSTPRPDDVAEAILNVQSLAANKQIADGPPDPASPVLPTYRVETDSEGRRILRRRRLTAF
jgi:FMN phosphatase YigB (HAD superfamily)